MQHFFFSRQQNETLKNSMYYPEYSRHKDTYVLINDELVMYSESGDSKTPYGNWDDYVYLGTGQETFSGNSKEEAIDQVCKWIINNSI